MNDSRGRPQEEQAVSGQTSAENRTVVLFFAQAVQAASIGVFDSGVGGLTVAGAIRQALPSVPLHYVADSACAPYGERSPGFIRERSLNIAEHLIERGARLLVVACNTATAHAAQALREAFPQLPVVGIEPGVKPAVAATRVGRVGVLATTATVSSERFRRLIAQHAGGVQVTAVACSGVVSLIESGDMQSPELQSLVSRYCEPLRRGGVDTVLLGCTHYPLIRPLWQQALGPDVQLLQVEDAVAQQAARLWPLRQEGDGSLVLSSTADPSVLGRLAQQALGWRRFALEQAVVPGTGVEPVRPR